MTNYEFIQAMSVDEMALMFHALCKGIDDKWTDALTSQGVVFDVVNLSDEIQIAIHKNFLESEVEK